MEGDARVVLHSPVSRVYRRLFPTFSHMMLISRISYFHGVPNDSELDFLYDLQDALAKVPLGLQDTQAASACIHILGSQLLYSTATTRVLSSQGFELCRVLWATLHVRELIADEIQMIYRLATRRLER